MTLSAGAPARLAYVAGATTFVFVSDAPTAGTYTLEAGAPGFAAQAAVITLTGNVTTNFAFPP